MPSSPVFVRPPPALAAAALGVCLFAPAAAVAGPYSPPAGQAGSTAVAYDSPSVTEWASSVANLTRGPQDVASPAGPFATFGSPSDVLGPAGTSTSNVVSLGDGGSITVGFDRPITNGPGADLAVFENSFDGRFLELGYVDVSSDGVHFTRFPSVSLTQTATQEGGFADDLDSTDLHDLAGSFKVGFGTPFDLGELAGSPNLDVNDVRYVRVTDVVGRITPVLDGNNNVVFSPSLDSLGNVINDPYATPFATGGFDLDGVAVLNAAAVPEPASLGLMVTAGLLAAGRRRR